MEQNTFSPQITPRTDSVSNTLFGTARVLIMLMMGLLPLFFIPDSLVSVGTNKVYFVVFMLLLVVIISSLGILRKGSLIFSFSPILITWFVVVLTAFVSAILSPTLMSALIGTGLEIQTVGFLFLLGLVMISAIIFSDSKKSLMYVFLSFIFGAFFLSLWQLVRIFISPDILSFGFLAGNTSSILGSFNDLGIFICLAIVLSLITLIQLSLPTKISLTLTLAVVVMLVLLTIINFFALWVILALLSLALLMYNLTKGRYEENITGETKTSLLVILLLTLIFIISVIFLIGGNSFGNLISTTFGVNYVEVRPSVTATLDIMRSAYQENAFTGIGPNRFADAWSLYKDSSINQTIFWNTIFSAGNGYIPTWFVTTGILGVLSWFVFLLVFLYTGIKMLIKSKTTDVFWYYIGTISFVSALFVWVMAIIYVPGPVILIMGAFATGVMLVAYQTLLPGGQKVINFLTSARIGFILIFVVMVTIVTSIGVGYITIQQFVAYQTYSSINKIPADNNQLTSILEHLNKAYAFYPADIYVRDLANYQLLNMNRLISISEPTADDKQIFQETFTNAIQAAKEAIRLNPHDARNWSVLGDIFVNLATLKIEGASKNAEDAYNEARRLDPKNPYYDLQEAVMALRNGDKDKAREKANQALQLKQNYTDALFVVSQIDIASGDIKKAIATSLALVSLDASNPGRYYQLGVLLAADNDHLQAIEAFSRAIILNPSYANALYLRAQQYLVSSEKDKALADLGMVKNLNPDNSFINQVINEIKQGNTDPAIFNATDPIVEPVKVETKDQVTTTNEPTDTNLVTPINANTTENKPDSDIKDAQNGTTTETLVQ